MRLIFLALVVFALILVVGVGLSRGAALEALYAGAQPLGLQGMPSAKHLE